jgi:hypothetical protein
VTKAQLWNHRLSNWRTAPAHFVGWLFTSEFLIDRRAIWVEMRTADHGGLVADETAIDTTWSEVLEAFVAEARTGFRAD